MAYLGNNNLPFDPTRTSPAPRDADRFSGNGSTTSFTLSRSVSAAVDIQVFVENVQQEPITAYDVSGTSLNFTGAPPSGTNNVYVVYRNFQNGAQVIMQDGSVTYSKLANNLRVFTTDNLTPNGNNSVFTLSEPPADANTVMVTVDGIIQRAPVHYTTSGSTITFTSSPAAGSNVHVRHLGFRTSTTVTAIPVNSYIPQPNIATPTITSPSITGGTLTSSTLITPSISGNVAFSNTNSLTVSNTGGTTIFSTNALGLLTKATLPFVTKRGTTATTTTGAVTIMGFATTVRDTIGSSTYGSYAIRPQLSGYYLVIADMAVSFNSGSSAFTPCIYLYQNGSSIKSQPGIITYSSGHAYSGSITHVVYCNGSTDYFEMAFGHNGGGTATLSDGSFTMLKLD